MIMTIIWHGSLGVIGQWEISKSSHIIQILNSEVNVLSVGIFMFYKDGGKLVNKSTIFWIFNFLLPLGVIEVGSWCIVAEWEADAATRGWRWWSCKDKEKFLSLFLQILGFDSCFFQFLLEILLLKRGMAWIGEEEWFWLKEK